MTKPIFLIGYSINIDLEQIEKISTSLSEKMVDYHVFFYPTYSEKMEFQTFYEKDFNEIRYEELKQMIQDKLNKHD